jgi:predicted DNA-binding WGR domain protein
LDSGSVAAERFGMADRDDNNFPPMHIVLEREDPARNIARYYVLSIEPTLFAKATLVRRWGRLGSAGRERLLFCDNAAGAETALQTWLDRKRRRGYLGKS